MSFEQATRPARAAFGGVVYVIIVIVMGRVALGDLGGEGARAGGYVVADAMPWGMLLGLLGLPLAIVLTAVISGRKLTSDGPLDRRAGAILVGLCVLVLVAAIGGKGLALRAGMAFTGRVRCEALDELHQSRTGRRNDRMFQAYVDLRVASTDVLARCGYGSEARR